MHRKRWQRCCLYINSGEIEMFCKNCFKKISNRSNFCKYCGAPVKHTRKLKEEKPGAEPPVQGPPPAPKEDSSGFLLRSEKEKAFPVSPRAIGFGIALILLVTMVVVFIKSPIFQNPNSISYSKYIGVWQERGSDDVEVSGGVRLEIISVSGNTLSLSLGFYDGSAAYNGVEAKNIGATLNNGKAYYTFSDDGYGNSGNGVLTFKGRDIEWKSVLNKDDPVYYEVVKVKNHVSDEETLAGQEPQATKESTENPASGDYILPESSTRYVTEEDLADLTAQQMRIARNEIMARHGRKFNDKELQTYFESKAWYKGTIDPETFDRETQKELNQYETKNIAFIKSRE